MSTNNSMKQEWEQFKEALDKRIQNYSNNLAEPAKKEKIEELQTYLECNLPDEFII